MLTSQHLDVLEKYKQLYRRDIDAGIPASEIDAWTIGGRYVWITGISLLVWAVLIAGASHRAFISDSRAAIIVILAASSVLFCEYAAIYLAYRIARSRKVKAYEDWRQTFTSDFYHNISRMPQSKPWYRRLEISSLKVARKLFRRSPKPYTNAESDIRYTSGTALRFKHLLLTLSIELQELARLS